jgi:hypothetical protein
MYELFNLLNLSTFKPYSTIARKPTIIANSAAPSTRAAVKIMFARISLEASGWRAIDSKAPLPI